MAEEDKKQEIDIKVNIEAKDVNEYVAKAVLESKIGEEVKKAVDKYVSEMSNSYRNPLENVVKDEIQRIMHDEILKNYRPQLEKMVKEAITEEIVKDVFSKAWEAFKEKW